MELKYYVNYEEVTAEAFKNTYYEECKKRRIEWFGTWNDNVKQKVEEDMHDFFEVDVPRYLNIQGFVGRQYIGKSANYYSIKISN